jgi:hypothetical protein
MTVLRSLLVGLALIAVACGSTAPGEPSGVTGPLLFATTSAGVFAFHVDPVSGSLQPVPGSPFAISASEWIRFDPRGRFLFAGSGGVVFSYRIDPATGALKPSPVPSQLDRSPYFSTMALAPDGRFAYVLRRRVGPFDCQVEGDITLMAVDPVSGALTVVPGGLFTTGVSPSGLVFAGGFAYAANAGDPVQLYGPCPVGSVIGYAVDRTSGVLTTLPGPPFAMALRNSRLAAAGSSVYVVQDRQFSDEFRRNAPATLARFRVEAGSGALAPLSAVSLPTLEEWAGLSLDPLDRFVYIATFIDIRLDGEWYRWTLRVEASGALTVADRSMVAPDDAAVPVIEPGGRFAYRAHGNVVEASRVDPTTGALQPLSDPPLSLGVPVRGIFLVGFGS